MQLSAQVNPGPTPRSDAIRAALLSLFWNASERRLRALWRIAVQNVMMVALALLPVVLVAEPLTAMHRQGRFLSDVNAETYDRLINMMVGPLLLFAIVASVLIAARWLDKRSISDLGVRLDGAWWSNLALGFTVGAFLMTLVFGFEYAVGLVEVTGFVVARTTEVVISLLFAFTVVKIVCVGVYEEFVSRGYHLRNLSDGVGMPLAVALSSATFAVLHIVNDNASLMSSTGLFVNGAMFAVAVIATGRLSTAIGLHMSWNLFEGAVFGFPVSGDKEGASLVAINQLGPDAITGGAFGPEAGLLGIIASILGIVIILVVVRARAVRRERRMDGIDAAKISLAL